MRGICIFIVMMVVMAVGVNAVGEGMGFTDDCYGNTLGVTIYFGGVDPLVLENFGITNNCTGGSSIEWVDVVNLSILGDIVDGEVVIAPTFIYVDSVARPDLDSPAVLTFREVPYAVEPGVDRDGVTCGDCNITWDDMTRTMTVVVPGFSNYSLTARQDFTIYSDEEPELKEKVYQTIDLGDAKRGDEYSCIVQIYGLNDAGQYVLVQTNPERQVQAKLLGNPDPNQPESLGYFPTVNGMANVYFRGGLLSNIAGYSDFEYVAQCSSSNSTKLIYEEPISTRYSPLGRGIVGRGIWLVNDANAFFLVIVVVLVFIGGLLTVKVVRMILR